MTKEEVIEKRIEFFNDIIYSLQRKIGELDVYFQQDKYSIRPENKDFLVDPTNGELICNLSGSFFGTSFEVLYSVWQVGTLLKIGFLVKTEEVYEAFANDEQSEVLHVWHDKGNLTIKPLHGGIFYDWEFNVNNIYDSYLIQENYSMGIRHMHLRVLKTIYDYLEKKLNQFK